MQKTEVKIARWIEAGFNLYKNNFTTLVLAALIALVLSTVTVGILTGPMIAGLIIITLRLLRKTDPEQRIQLFFKFFSLYRHLGNRHPDWIPDGRVASHHRAIAFFVHRLCRPGLSYVRSFFDCRPTDAFLAGFPKKHRYRQNQFLAFSGPGDDCQHHRQHRRNCLWYRYRPDRPDSNLYSGRRLSGNIRRSNAIIHSGCIG